MNFSQFLQPAYWFSSTPLFNLQEMIFYGIFFLLLLVGGIILKKIYGRKSKEQFPYDFFSKIFFSWFLTCSLIGFVLLFFRWQQIPYFSNRILLVADFLILLAGLIGFLFYQLKKLPQDLEQFRAKTNYEKYLPKPKKISSKFKVQSSKFRKN